MSRSNIRPTPRFSARLKSIAWLTLAACTLLSPVVLPGLYYGSGAMIAALVGCCALTAGMGTLALEAPVAVMPKPSNDKPD